MAPRSGAQAGQEPHKRQRRTSTDKSDRVRGYTYDPSGEDERAYARSGPSKAPRATPTQPATDTDKSWKERRLQRKRLQIQQGPLPHQGGERSPPPRDAEDYWDRIAHPSVEARAGHRDQEQSTDAGAMQRRRRRRGASDGSLAPTQSCYIEWQRIERASSGHEHPSDLEGASDFSDCEERSAYIAARRSKREGERNLARKEELAARRLERMKALEEREAHSADDERHDHDRPGLGEITEDHMELMTRTAIALRGTTNPQQLTARILANHGQDPRFAFLKNDDQPGDDAWTLRSLWARMLKGERATWADVVAERSRRQDALCTDRQREVRKHKLEGLIYGYDSSGSDSDATDQARVKAETSTTIGGTDQVVSLATAENDGVHANHHVDNLPGTQDASLAASPKQAEAAALSADGPEGRKLSDRVIRARQWAAERRKITNEPSVTEGPEATATVQPPAECAGNVRDMHLSVEGLDPSTRERDERQRVAPGWMEATTGAMTRAQVRREDLSAEGEEAGPGVEGGVKADDDVLDLDAEDAAAAAATASRTMEAWQAEEVCFTIG